MKQSKFVLLALVLSTAMLSAGCVQMPTEKQSIVDMRPGISFRTDSERNQTARVVIDDLDFGRVGDYLDGASAMRLLPGTHNLRVVLGSEILLNEKFYLGDGVNRTFLVK